MENGDILRGRYKIIRKLGRGGFGETYLAVDLDLPGEPKCVVKKLHAIFKSAKELEIAKRFFDTEAQVLYNLGDRHRQIPHLLAHFEENSNFYLVQDFVDGQDLSKEFASGKRWNEAQVISFLKDILVILEVVHQQKVIHRDIKPANIIRRKQDDKLVLIDFGAVKELPTIVNTQANTYLTVGIGTQGYMPLDQRAGKPRYNSDIYAVGMTAIQALTGIHPEQLPEDQETDEVVWRGQAKVSDRLAAILDKMVKVHYRDRYQSTGEILQDLDKLNTRSAKTVAPPSRSKPGGSTVISNVTKQQSVTTRQQSVVSNTAPDDEPKPKRSFGLAIALSAIGAVAATLGVSQLVEYLQSKPTSQPIAQTTPQASPIPAETPVESPSPLAVTPEASPSPIASATPEASPVAVPPAITKASPIVSNSQNAVPLIDTKCLTTTASTNSESFVKGPEDVTIGQEVVTAIAFLRGQSNYVSEDSAAGVACLIASADSNAQFRKLRLTFGISNTNDHTGTINDSAVLGLTVYLDRRKIGTKEVKRGEKQFWEINVANAQNVALEAECVKPKRYSSYCPSLVFTQADLE